ncbi:hypothetical protein CCMA1212_006349 [Trichoderma ghanense]|uniref:Uncharacterized protein n=1 Tax=Trichoderma ghanense TaxID=65468 RepID=A0ABY2H1T9_9HYPO
MKEGDQTQGLSLSIRRLVLGHHHHHCRRVHHSLGLRLPTIWHLSPLGFVMPIAVDRAMAVDVLLRKTLHYSVQPGLSV